MEMRVLWKQNGDRLPDEQGEAVGDLGRGDAIMVGADRAFCKHEREVHARVPHLSAAFDGADLPAGARAFEEAPPVAGLAGLELRGKARALHEGPPRRIIS